MAIVLSFFEAAQLLGRADDDVERPFIVHTFSHTPLFLPMHASWRRN